MTIQDFIRKHQITFTASPTASNPNMDDMPAGSRHFACRFGFANSPYALTCYFSQGPAHTEPPTAEDVLDCLASDASGYENAPRFEDWAGEYGYDTDSRRAERTFRAVEAQAASLRTWLRNGTGSFDAFSDLLWEIERL